MKSIYCLLVAWMTVLLACHQQPAASNEAVADASKTDTIGCAPGSGKVDTALLQQVTGMKGMYKNGEFKITVPQHDLKVVVDGFRIIPAMGLGSWTCFTPCADSVMAMGDMVLTETDLAPVQQEVVRQGFAITAIHNHFVRNHPNILYMHIDGKGKADKVAAGIKAIYDKVKEVRGRDPKASPADSVATTINVSALDSIIGYKGEWNKGVYKYTIGRPDVSLQEHGIPVSSFAGFNTWAAWQGTPERAAVAGDFAMLEEEVKPVIAALVGNGIEVVAVHNHMVHEKPRIFFLHYWGVGPARQLAHALRSALDQTGKGNRH